MSEILAPESDTQIVYVGSSEELCVVVQPSMEEERYAYLHDDECSFSPLVIFIPKKLFRKLERRLPVITIEGGFDHLVSLVARQAFGAGMLSARTSRRAFRWRRTLPRIACRYLRDERRLAAYHWGALVARPDLAHIISFKIKGQLARSLQVDAPQFSPFSLKCHITHVAQHAFQIGSSYPRKAEE